MCQAFHAVPAAHAPAVAFAYFPTVARLLEIKFCTPASCPRPFPATAAVRPARPCPSCLVTVALGNGFILDRHALGRVHGRADRPPASGAAAYLFLLAALTFVGMVHSACRTAHMYLPWNLPGWARACRSEFALGYAVLGFLVLGLSFSRGSLETEEA